MGELEVIRNLNDIPEIVASAHIHEDIPIMYKLPDGRILEAILADCVESPDIVLSNDLEEDMMAIRSFINHLNFFDKKNLVIKTGNGDGAPVLKWFVAEYGKEARQ